jgi:hypothetical protein
MFLTHGPSLSSHFSPTGTRELTFKNTGSREGVVQISYDRRQPLRIRPTELTLAPKQSAIVQVDVDGVELGPFR